MDALGRVFELVAPSLRSCASNLVQDQELAADILQETFLVVVNSETEPQAESSVFPWMCGIVRNLVRQHHREITTRKPNPERLHLRSSTSPVDALQREQVREAIQSAIQSLPDPYRQVLHLHIERDLSPESIAAELGREVDTVYKQISRGKTRLQQTLPKDLLLLAIATIAASCATPAARTTSGVPETPTRAPALLAGVALMLAAVALWALWPPSTPDPAVAAAPGGSPKLAIHVANDSEPEAEEQTTRTAIPSASTGARVELECRWEHTGLPVVGLSLRLDTGHVGPRTPLRAYEKHWRHSVTNESGVAVFERVAPGTARLLLDDGLCIHATFQVTRGLTPRTAIAIPKPVQTIRGVVRDRAGKPIADAGVWLSSTSAMSGPGYVAARSNPDGEYAGYTFRPSTYI